MSDFMGLLTPPPAAQTPVPPSGFGGIPAPTVPAAPAPRPIDGLAPGSEQHARVKKYVKDRIEFSEDAMSKFYSRWRVNEKKFQAYVDLPKYEQILEAMNKSGKVAGPVSITVPYSFATIWTIVTYLVHTFTGRNPLFTVMGNRQDSVIAAQNMEKMLQYNADHTRLVRHLFQWFLDGEVYGVGVMRTMWKNESAMRTVWRQSSPGGILMPGMQQQLIQAREQKIIYEGNDCATVDPFMFFPDPRVPMVEVNKRGEFVAWRTFDGKHTLKSAEAAGLLKYVDAAPKMPNQNDSGGGNSARSLRSGGEASPGERASMVQDGKATDYYQVDQGTFEIVPSELGLGPGTTPEKWLFTLLNKEQIVQAEPLSMDHGKHPISVIEPYSMGYGFGQVGASDMLGPLQDMISWFVNSHVHNVRSALNNMFLVDPSKIEMQDLKNPEPGKLIRLKQTAYGQDVREIIHQFQVQDVTRTHITDLREFMRMGDGIAAVNDNLRGIQEAGGRKTATEVRTSGEAGASRLASHAKLVSAQGVVDLTEQMSLNIQQYTSQEFQTQVLGPGGSPQFITIAPEHLVGDFTFPIHDGTLPIDKTALVDIWREILMGVAQDPILRMQYSIGGIFEFVAKLGGAVNIEQFRLNPMPPEQMDRMLAGGMMQNLGAVGGSGIQGGPPGGGAPSAGPPMG